MMSIRRIRIRFLSDYGMTIAYYSPRIHDMRIEDNTFTSSAHRLRGYQRVNYLITGKSLDYSVCLQFFQRDTRYMKAMLDLVANRSEASERFWLTRPVARTNDTENHEQLHHRARPGIAFIFPPLLSVPAHWVPSTPRCLSRRCKVILAHSEVTALFQTTSMASPPNEI